MIHNLLSSNEIADILNNHLVITNKAKLSSQTKVDFFIELPVEIKAKLESGFGIPMTSIPMRWIKGDTPEHVDKGIHDFNNTSLMYLTDSVGNLIIDGQSYPINAGDAYVFNEGLSHSTINTGDNERLMIGPMSELGFHVGASFTVIYFNNKQDANQSAASINEFGYPDATAAIYFTYGDYTIITNNDISSWLIATNTDGIEPSPNGGPHNAGDELVPTGIYYLYPTPPSIIYFETETDAIQAIAPIYSVIGSYIIVQVGAISSWLIQNHSTSVDYIPPSPNGGPYNAGAQLIETGTYYLYPSSAPPPPPPDPPTTITTRFSMRSLFTNNAQVYYKRGSLSTGSGGSGVTNSRIKKRRT